MPLIQSKSKKAMSENIKSEMNAGKPQKQSIAIAYDIQRRNKKKKMADGGEVDEQPKPVQSQKHPVGPEEEKRRKQMQKAFNPDEEPINKAMGGEVSASNEKRPMPDEEGHDKSSISRNSAKKASKNDSWTDNVTVKQAQKPSITKLSEPKINGSDVFSVRSKKMMDEERDLMDSMPPESPDAQPPKGDDEIGPDREGPALSDTMYADGGEVTADSITSEELDMIKKHRMAKGGRVDMEPKDSGIELMEREDEANMQSRLAPASPSEQPKKELDEEGADRQGPSVDHPKSVVEAILQKRRMYADGGEVDLAQNAREEPNNEDQMSFEALKKENYSESAGLDALDQPMDSNEKGHDLPDEDEHNLGMIDSIVRKMRAKRGL